MHDYGNYDPEVLKKLHRVEIGMLNDFAALCKAHDINWFAISGTAIGANHREAIAAESEVDFVHKLAITQKECNETLYWLELLKATDYIDEKLFNSLYADAEEIMRMLTASIITVKKRLKNNTISAKRAHH